MVNPELRRKLRFWKRRLTGKSWQPIITAPQGDLPVGSAPYTFVVVVGPNFNQTIPNAATTCRMGWCRGFEQREIPYLLLSVFELSDKLPEIPQPICWISGSDYAYLNRKNLRSLKEVPHIVWGSTWFKNDTHFYERNNYPQMSWPKTLTKKILSSEPNFVFTISPERSFEFYEGWIQNDATLVSLPLACDTWLYNKETPVLAKFNEVKMAFVGGYWPYKARHFEIYLRPFEDHLNVFGYSPWPYKNYGGGIDEAEEPSLYKQSAISPVINEPHVSVMGVDINERVFKVLGSHGFAVTDVTPGYREWFTEDELLVPENPDQYYQIIEQALKNPEFTSAYREQGYQAVLSRHTYAHRAQTVLDHLGISVSN
jgi:hypothetical protein